MVGSRRPAAPSTALPPSACLPFFPHLRNSSRSHPAIFKAALRAEFGHVSGCLTHVASFNGLSQPTGFKFLQDSFRPLRVGSFSLNFAVTNLLPSHDVTWVYINQHHQLSTRQSSILFLPLVSISPSGGSIACSLHNMSYHFQL